MPIQEIKILEMIIDLKEMTISLPQQNPQTTILIFTKVLDHLTLIILAILAAKLHCCFSKQQQIQALKKNSSNQSVKSNYSVVGH